MLAILVLFLAENSGNGSNENSSDPILYYRHSWFLIRSR